jgi:hypothetical protein
MHLLLILHFIGLGRGTQILIAPLALSPLLAPLHASSVALDV